MNSRDFRNIREAKKILKEERYSDSKESMINQILDRMDDLKSELDESVTKSSLVDLIEALTAIDLVTEEKEVKKPKKYPVYDGPDGTDYFANYEERYRGGDFDGQGTRV